LKWSSIAAIVLLLLILFFWRDSTAPLNPYEVLGVSKGFTKRELSKAYRNLAIQFDPDLHKDDPEKQKKYLQLTKAYEILSDEKKLDNWEKYGNPNGPDSTYYDDKYPEFILNAGKHFVYIWLVLVFVVLSLPVTMFIIPNLKNPPEVFRRSIEDKLKEGEKFLVDASPVCLEYFQAAEDQWKLLLLTFPRYETSIWAGVFPFKIACRRAQYKIAVEGKVEGLVEEFTQLKYNFKNNSLKSKEVQMLISGVINDTVSTVGDASKSSSKAILTKFLALLQSFKTYK